MTTRNEALALDVAERAVAGMYGTYSNRDDLRAGPLSEPTGGLVTFEVFTATPNTDRETVRVTVQVLS